MTTEKDKLLTFLKEIKDDHSKLCVNNCRLKEEWITSVTNLINQIESWLDEMIDADLVTVIRKVETIEEYGLGSYSVPSLKILTKNVKTIYVMPTGYGVLGFEGRVDISCSTKFTKEMILRQKNKWYTLKEDFNLKRFTSKSFYKILSSLLE